MLFLLIQPTREIFKHYMRVIFLVFQYVVLGSAVIFFIDHALLINVG